MNALVQYTISLSLFVAIPVAVQWAVTKFSAKRNLPASAPEPVAQAVSD